MEQVLLDRINDIVNAPATDRQKSRWSTGVRCKIVHRAWYRLYKGR